MAADINRATTFVAPDPKNTTRIGRVRAQRSISFEMDKILHEIN
jgi:hypothetical protein